jgi:hypothetical protein
LYLVFVIFSFFFLRVDGYVALVSLCSKSQNNNVIETTRSLLDFFLVMLSNLFAR